LTQTRVTCQIGGRYGSLGDPTIISVSEKCWNMVARGEMVERGGWSRRKRGIRDVKGLRDRIWWPL